jgi:hypothetical protein
MPLRRRFLLYAPSNSITLQKVVPESFEFVPEHAEGVRRAGRDRAGETRGARIVPSLRATRIVPSIIDIPPCYYTVKVPSPSLLPAFRRL